MYRIIKIYFPRTCIIFTLVMVSTVIMDLLYGKWDSYDLYMLQILGSIILFYVGDCLIEKVNFRTCRIYVITHYSVILGLYLIYATIFGWLQYNIESILGLIIPFTIIYVFMYVYIGYINRKEADSINQLLNNKSHSLE